METYSMKLKELYESLGTSKKMVLSTAYNNHVSSRMMSVIMINGCFYFQTDKKSRKYQQLVLQPQVALCMDNIQVEGMCTIEGHPLENQAFCKLYEEAFKHSYDKYTWLKDECLVKVDPYFVEKWVYLDGEPYIETLDLKAEQYKILAYLEDNN